MTRLPHARPDPRYLPVKPSHERRDLIIGLAALLLWGVAAVLWMAAAS